MAQGSPQDGRNTLADIDITKPNVARVYDYFVGGKDNFTADRDYASKVLEVAPKAAQSVLQNREFLRRVVRHMAESGIDQFLDLGSGLPTQGNVSEVAHEVNPAAHVVYVDNDPMVYIHSRALLSDQVTVDIVSADVRDPGEILAAPAVESLLDLDRPIGLLMLAVLHHLPDADQPGSVVARFRDAVPPGSGRWREDAELRTWFGDWELLEPGFVALQEWRPAPGDLVEDDTVFQSVYGGVARKK